MYEPDDDDFWDEQSRLPLLKRSVLWWSEVALSNVVGTLVVIAFAAFLLIGLIAAFS